MAQVIAYFQAKRSIAERRLAGFYTFSAAVAQLFIDGIFVIVVIGILFIHFTNNPSF